ncbi:MAG TPA: macrolide ABC transporter ATP-binding protein, partial [Desulfobacterales bacterium]|nr:macrolide ABC transporter ATP-binding protein [Desulfobacterales bacterium]
QQRVAIARAIVNKPALLLADEPTGNLDRETGFQIMKLLIQLNQSQGLSIVMVTHDLEMAAFADRRIVLRDGVIISES